jgi:hypothetical protein
MTCAAVSEEALRSVGGVVDGCWTTRAFRSVGDLAMNADVLIRVTGAGTGPYIVRWCYLI